MKKLTFLAIFLFSAAILSAQNIQGVINIYTPVNNIVSNTLTVGSVAGFSIGDKVMVIKMKGATIDQNNTINYGDTIAMNGAGRYQFSRITSINGNDVTLFPFCNIYDGTTHIQMISVPEYPNPTVVSNLTCAPWNGTVGGVLVFETPGTLTLNDSIDVSGRGFRGGQLLGGAFNCGAAQFFSSLVLGIDGQKGEGVAEYILGQECGAGKLANGGGGAYAGNAGAGGGANGGGGGQGGNQFSGCNPNTKNGIGGVALNRTNNHLYVGGGGGASQEDNNRPIFPGGDGGGLVYITANNIVGNNNYILSNGDSVQTIGDEGGAGGGAGGSVYLVSTSYTGSLNVQAKGGKGSDNFNTVFSTQGHGPGGGGGGGVVAFSQGATPAGVTTSVVGGASGLIRNPSSTFFNTSYGASNGTAGQNVHNFVCYTAAPININLGPDQTICFGQTITLDAGSGYASYLWDDNSTGQTRTVTAPGTFYVFVAGNDGCTGTDTVEVIIDTSIKANFTFDIDFGCNRDTVHFTNTSTGGGNYIWFFGDGNSSNSANPTHIYGAQGAYSVRLVAGTLPCFDTIDIPVIISHTVSAVIGLSLDSICLGDQIAVDDFSSQPTPAQGGHTTLWDFGDGTTSNLGSLIHTYTQPGIYTLKLVVTDTIGCKDSTTQQIFVEPSSFARLLISDDNICLGEKIFFMDSIGGGSINYTYDFDDGILISNFHNPSHTYEAAGTYNVTLTAFYEICPIAQQDTLITVSAYPQINLGEDRTFCPGFDSSAVLFNELNQTQILEWSTGVKQSSISVKETGQYWARAISNGCETTDSVLVKRDCYLNIPNSFSPNNDGTNDYFIPRQLLAAGVTDFGMRIMNRWGEVIFQTVDVNGRGWDGKFGGQDQPVGVYVYQIEAKWKNGYRNVFTGNLTLLR